MLARHNYTAVRACFDLFNNDVNQHNIRYKRTRSVGSCNHKRPPTSDDHPAVANMSPCVRNASSLLIDRLHSRHVAPDSFSASCVSPQKVKATKNHPTMANDATTRRKWPRIDRKTSTVSPMESEKKIRPEPTNGKVKRRSRP